MKKLALVSFALFAVPAAAKCYSLSKAPSDVYVCVGKNGSDSFADRKKAQEICKQQTGSDCGNVSSYSSSCHSNSNKCYDENGKASRDLKDY
ncbi:MAG: hypothetical protein ACOZQL_35535 [Myxococcota bacterium]